MIYVLAGILDIDELPVTYVTNDGNDVTVTEIEQIEWIERFDNADDFQFWGRENLNDFGILPN